MILALIGLAAVDVDPPARHHDHLGPGQGLAVGPADHARDPFTLHEPDVEDLLPRILLIYGRDDREIAHGLDASPVGLDAELGEGEFVAPAVMDPGEFHRPECGAADLDARDDGERLDRPAGLGVRDRPADA